MKRYFILLVLNLLLMSCTTTQPLPSPKGHQFIPEPSQYSTEKGSSLALAHQKNVDNIFRAINATYEGISFTPVTRSGNGITTGGIGFFIKETGNNDEEHRCLGINISTDDIFYIDPQSPERSSLRIETIYIKYIRDLLKIMTDEEEILADDAVEGLRIRIAWFNQLGTEPSSNRSVEDLIVSASKSDAYDYSHRQITTQDFLSRTDLFRFSQNISMEKIDLNAASLSRTSVAHASPLSESVAIGTLNKDSEVIIHSYKNGFFGFPDNSAFVSKENFIITGFLRSLVKKNELEIIKRKRELESRKNWVRSLAVNVRADSSKSSSVIDTLKKGAHVFIQEENNNWSRVYYSEPDDAAQFKSIDELTAAYKKGWIYKKLLSSDRVDSPPAAKERPAPVAVNARTGNAEYYIQVGAWKYPRHARRTLAKLRQYYPEAYITEINYFHKIRIPEIQNNDQAADISKDIEEKFNLKPLIVRKK